MAARFLWGAATSAHQVEGDNWRNDWSAWEEHLPLEQRSGKACDHWQRYPEDFALAKSLSHNAHRLSLEWSRIEPRPGEIDNNAVRHYRDVLRELKRQGLASFVTLHHFTNPLWLARRGGWLNRTTPQHFAFYAKVMADKLGDLVDAWVTINEPTIYAGQGYWRGVWPPGRVRDWRGYLAVIKNMARAHSLAYHGIHEVRPGAQVGIAQNAIAFWPARPRAIWDLELSKLLSRWYNHRFFRLTSGTHDFVGLNYYHSSAHGLRPRPPFIFKQPGIDPEGFLKVLKEFKRYRLPIYITENGVADARDDRRAEYIRRHLRAVEEAQQGGTDVRGYFYWSLLDNFEWADGFKSKFGLVAVDPQTQARQPRPAAYAYRAIIEQAQTKP